MKNRIAPFALLLLAGFGSVAHAQTTPPKPSTPAAAKSGHGDYMTMKDGQMMMSHGGKMMPMTKDMKMADGTMCMTDGTCMMKDGTSMKMKEGDHCMMQNGKMKIHPAGAKGKPMKTGDKMGNMKM